MIHNNIFWGENHQASPSVADGGPALALYPQNDLCWSSTHLKLCIADAIHNFKSVKIIQLWQNEGQRFFWIHVTFYL